MNMPAAAAAFRMVVPSLTSRTVSLIFRLIIRVSLRRSGRRRLMLDDWLCHIQYTDSGTTIPIADMLLDLCAEMLEDVAYCHRSSLPEPTIGKNLHVHSQ